MIQAFASPNRFKKLIVKLYFIYIYELFAGELY